MSLDNKPCIELFLGAPLQEPSEIQFFKEFTTSLEKHNTHAIVFANFYAGRLKQQVDFMVITPNCACVVELKSFLVHLF